MKKGSEKEGERGKGKKRALETTFLYVSRDFFQLQTAPFASRLAAIIFKTRIFPSAPGHNEEGVGEGGGGGGEKHGRRAR